MSARAFLVLWTPELEKTPIGNGTDRVTSLPYPAYAQAFDSDPGSPFAFAQKLKKHRPSRVRRRIRLRCRQDRPRQGGS